MEISQKDIRRYLLIYEIKDFPGNGGGIFYKSFDSVGDAEEWINKKTEGDQDNLMSLHGLMEVENIKNIAPVTRITKFEVK